MRIRYPTLLLAIAVSLLGNHAQAGLLQTMPEVLIPIRMPGDPPVLLPSLAGGSGLPLTWEVSTGPATVSGNVVTLTGELGPVTLKASQEGDAMWEPLVGRVSFSVTEEGGYTQVSMGGEGSSASYYALSRAGRITGWNTYRSNGPVTTAPATRWSYVSSGGGTFPYAISEDGSLWVWNDSFVGAIPKQNGEAGAPTRVGADSDWSVVAAGRHRRLGIKKDGTLWGWEDQFGGTMAQPAMLDSRTDWVELSISSQDYAVTRRSGGECYHPKLEFPRGPVLIDSGLWKTGSISQGGIVRVRMDGTLWFRYSEDRQLSPATDWAAVGALRSSYLALRLDGTLWEGIISGGSTVIRPPIFYPASAKWAKISPGFATAGLIAADGSLWTWNYSLRRTAPAFLTQTLDFMAAREQPFPVVSGSTLEVPESALNSKLPPDLTLVGGPAEITGQGISFTGPGLVEVTFKQAGNATWGAFEERRTFLSGAPGPEIAVHDGTSAQNASRRDGGTVVNLGKKTRAETAEGLVRAFVIENTGTHPLNLSAITAEAAGPLTFTTPFPSASLEPGGILPLALTLQASEYGIHTLTVLLHSNDADEPAYRIPFQIQLANTSPFASTGPDRQVHAGSALRLDGSFFSKDQEQATSALTYAWDLDGNGYHSLGAIQQITLPNPGQRLTAKLRVTDGDGATAYSECVITAVNPGMDIPTAIRVGADGFYDLVFRGVPGRKYRAFISGNLTSWDEVDGHRSPQPPPVTCGDDGFFSIHAGLRYGERSFYRAFEVAE